MARNRSQTTYEPYTPYPSFQSSLFPSSPTSYPEMTAYSQLFKFNYPLFAKLRSNQPPPVKPQPRSQFVYPRQRPPSFTPFQTIETGSHSKPPGIHISEPSEPIQSIPIDNKLKQPVTSQPVPPSYSTVTSVPTAQHTTPHSTPSIGILQDFNQPISSQESSDSETEESTPTHTSDSSENEIADISRIAMVQPNVDEEFAESHVEHPDDNPPPPRQDHSYKPTSGPWFTFDDLPYDKWRSRLQEFSAWIDLQVTAQQIPLEQALQEFFSRFTGTLREWFHSMSEYEKLQAVRVADASLLLGAIHKEFLRDFTLIQKREKQ
ncbi:hypothetical protein K1719_040776 [Acacia pycnantha]|nr:hypothetical protein K1719_040776 [Acacia pycnantha]